jgi:hypothetical protein
LKLIFTTEHLSTEGARPLQVSCLCTKTFGKKAKLRAITQALLNTQILPKGMYVEELIDRPCRLSIVHETKEDGSVFANIAKVFPPAGHFATAPVGTAVSAPANTGTVVTAPPQAAESTASRTVVNAKATLASSELNTNLAAALKNIHAKQAKEAKEPFTTGGTEVTAAALEEVSAS